MEELLSLKWNNHRSTFLHILTILRDKQLYTDATLACDGKFYNVHRLVLSTCSDYFSAMFDRTTCKNPIIVLKDIKCEDLEALLDYMYLGEVNVRQADLASLIKAAECLRVKGLAVPDDEPPQKRGRGDTSNLRRSDGGSPPSKRKRRDEGQDGREDIRPSGGSGSSRPKTPQSHSRLSPIPPPESGSDPNSSPNNHLHQPPLDSTQSMDGDAPKVKLEMEDTGGGDDIGGDHGFNIQNESFKEEGNEDPVGDLSSDLPEFLQQSSDGTYPHSFPGPSFQPDLQNWQGDQVLSSNNFSGMGFSSQTQEGSQNTSGERNPKELHDHLSMPSTASSSSSALPSSSLNTNFGVTFEATDDGTTCRCPICWRVFTGPRYRRKYNFKVHLGIHYGLKPFECTFCNRKFSRKSSVKSHQSGGYCSRQKELTSASVELLMKRK